MSFKPKVQFFVIVDEVQRFFAGFSPTNGLVFTPVLDDAKMFKNKQQAHGVMSTCEFFNCCQVVTL
jgi:hypothetical protein